MILLAGAAALLLQQATPAGFYTPAQADRGKALYKRICAECHGAEPARPDPTVVVAVAGPGFASSWPPAATLEDLAFEVRSMPPGGADPLTEEQSILILAYLLHENGYPAGKAELRADSTVLRTRLRASGDGAKKPDSPDRKPSPASKK
jgi:polar amino acid transport system substrate-binding protein